SGQLGELGRLRASLAQDKNVDFAWRANRVKLALTKPAIFRYSSASKITSVRVLQGRMAGFPPNCGSKRKERDVKTKRLFSLGVVAAAIVAFLASWPSRLSSQQGTSVSIDKDDIGGVVTSAKGPEAGVWVIAETNDLSTRFARMVVTDDQGRYV